MLWKLKLETESVFTKCTVNVWSTFSPVHGSHCVNASPSHELWPGAADATPVTITRDMRTPINTAHKARTRAALRTSHPRGLAAFTDYGVRAREILHRSARRL